MKKLLLVFVSIVLLLKYGYAQDYPYSQYYESNLLYAPSFAGINEDFTRIGLQYRNCPTMPIAKDYSVTLDFFSKKLNSGFGAAIFSDNIADGLMTKTAFSLMYAYRIKLTEKWFARPGLNFNYNLSSINSYSCIFSDQYEISNFSGTPSSASNYEKPSSNTGYGDFHASWMFYTDKMHFAFAVNHLLKPNISTSTGESKLDYAYTFMGDYEHQFVKENPYTNFACSYLFQSISKTNSLNMNLYWKTNYLNVGTGLRGIPIKNENKSGVDAFVFYIGLDLKWLRLGYSYDFSINDRLSYSEVSLALMFRLIAGEKENTETK